jgi:hypothetical protein
MKRAYDKEKVLREIRTIHDMITDRKVRARDGTVWNDIMYSTVIERDHYHETLKWIVETVNKSITKNDLNENRLLLNGEYHTGPVVDWVHEVLTGLRDIAENTIGNDDDNTGV